MVDKLVEKIKKTLNEIQPFLKADGGDVKFIKLSDDGILYVQLLGACKTCPMSEMTLRAGIERIIIKKFPEIKRVEKIN